MENQIVQIMQIFALGVLLLRAGILLAGVLFCWLGYRLFSQVSTVSGADVQVGTLFKAKFFQVGPGVFFSLFGAMILTYTIMKPPVLDLRDMRAALGVAPRVAESGAGSGAVPGAQPAVAGEPPASGGSMTIAGATRASSGATDPAMLSRAGQQVSFIGRIKPNGAVAAQDVADIDRMSRQIRLSIMLGIWQAEWGDAADFSTWVRDGSGNPDPEARRFFERQ